MEQTNGRIGFIGIVVENRQSVPEVNRILSSFGDMIRGRLGLPDGETGVAVITLVIYGTTDQVGALTGRLGNLPGVTVKSALTQKTVQKELN